MLSTKYLVVVLICISIYNGAYGHGVLHVDNVYSSANRQIKVDNLDSSVAITTTTETREVEFTQHLSLAMSAPELGLAGSYLSIIGQNDVKFVSENDTIDMQGGHNFDTNSKTLSILGDEVVLESAGEINLLSRNQIGMGARDITFLAGDGGIYFSSETGPISVSTNGTLSFGSSTGLTIEAIRDVTLRTEEAFIADVSSGFSDFFSDGHVQLTSSNDISFTSGDFISVEADQFYITADNYTSIGTNARISSNLDEVRLNAYDRLLVDAENIEIYGDNAGARWIAEFGYIDVTSVNGNINFLSASASDDSRVLSETDFVVTEVNDDFTISALTAIEFTSEFDITLSLDRTVSVTSRRDTYVRSESLINYVASTNFATTAETLIFTTMDEATADESHGLIQLSALLPTFDIETLYGISAASLQMTARTSLTLTATDDLTILADYSDGTSQQLAINAGIFAMSSGSLEVEGGDIILSGSAATFKTTTDLHINSDKEKNSYLDFSSKLNRWTVQSFDHNAGDSIISSQSATSLDVGGKTSFTTTRIHDISMVLDKYTASAGKEINTQVGSDLNILVEGAASFSTSADNRISSEDYFSTNYRFTIFSSSLSLSADDLVITTDRNEETNDYLHFVFSETGDFTINNLVYVSGEETQILSNGQTYNAAAITLSSDDLEDIFFVVGSSLIDASDDLTIRGNNVFFTGAQELQFDASSFEIEAESNGVYFNSAGFISFSVDGDFAASTVDELIISSVETYRHTTDAASVIVDELSYIHSNAGTVTLDGASVSILNRDNVTVASGNSPDDKIDISVTGSLSFFGPSQKYISLSTPDGPTTITASSAIAGPTTFILTNNFEQSSGGLTSFTAKTSYAHSAFNVYSEGGDIMVQSVDTDIEINATPLTTINFINKAASLASEEFYDFEDILTFHSTSGSIAFIDTVSAAAFFDAAGSVHVETQSATNQGQINYISESGDVVFQSVHPADTTPFDHENYDISFTSGGDFIINIDTVANIDSSGDFMIHADQAITFTQQEFEASIWDDFTIISDLGSIFVDHTGTSIRIVTNNDDIPTLERENTIQFDSVQRMSVYANDQISFTVSGYGTTRRDVVGDSNIEEHWDQPIGFSLRTYDPEGDFVVQSRDDRIFINTFGTTIFDTDAHALIETHREQYWQNTGEFSMEATDGEVFIYGADGIDINVRANTYFLSSRYTDFMADNLFDADAQLDFLISSYHGDISFANYLSNAILWTSNGYTKVSGGSELNVIAQGDIFFKATDDVIITGDRGYYLTTTGQEITFTGESFGSTIDASEEINILAGGDLYLINQGNTAEDMKFTGDGVVFQTTAGDITFTAGDDAQITSEIILINSFGTSSTGRDTAQFQSGASTTFQTEGEIRINANNLFDLGEDLNPPYITFSAGDVSFLSQGNYEMKIDGQLVVETTTGRTALSSIAATSFVTGTDMQATSTAGDINVHSLHGSLGIIAQEDLNEDFENEIVITSQGLTTFTTGFVDVNSDNFVSSADFLQKISVGNDFTVTGATDGAITTRFNPTDEIILTANTATMNPSTNFKWSAINNVNLYTANTFFNIATGNTIFTGHDDNTDIVFGAGTSLSFTATVDLALSSRSLDIDVNLRPSEPRGDYDITVLGNFINRAASSLLEVNGNFGATAPVTTSTVGDYFRVLAVNDVTLNSGTRFDVDTENTFIGTRPYLAGNAPFSHDVNWDASAYTITVGGDATFVARDIFVSAAGVNTWTSTAGDMTVNNHGYFGDTTIESAGTYNINPSVSFTAYSGAETGRGDMHLNGNNVRVNSNVMSIQSVATAAQPTANVFFGAEQDIQFDGATLAVSATSDTEEHQGTIEMSTSGLNQFTSNTLRIQSVNAGFNSQSETLSVTANTQMSTLTHGLNAGIDLFGKTFTALTTTTFTSTAGIDHQAIATNGNIDLITLTRLTVTSDGKASHDDAGIQFKTDHDSGNIQFTTTSSTFDTNGSFDVHATDSILSSSTQGSTIDSKYAQFKTVGLANNLVNGNPVYDQPVGIQITAATMNFDSNDEDITFSATGTVTTTYNTDVTSFEGDSTYFTAHGIVEIDVPLLAHTDATNSINFISHERGITFGGESTDINVVANTVNMNTGLLQESAAFRVTGSNVLFTAAGVNTLSADNNALFGSGDLTSITATNDDIHIDATKGDILFRMIDSPVNTLIHSLTFSAQNIYMTAYYRIEHRQHQELGFFRPELQTGPRTTSSAPRQGTTFFNYLQPLGPFVNGCLCTGLTDRCAANAGCPTLTARIIQMQAALEAYGLLKYTNFN